MPYWLSASVAYSSVSDAIAGVSSARSETVPVACAADDLWSVVCFGRVFVKAITRPTNSETPPAQAKARGMLPALAMNSNVAGAAAAPMYPKKVWTENALPMLRDEIPLDSRA